MFLWRRKGRLEAALPLRQPAALKVLLDPAQLLCGQLGRTALKETATHQPSACHGRSHNNLGVHFRGKDHSVQFVVGEAHRQKVREVLLSGTQGMTDSCTSDMLLPGVCEEHVKEGENQARALPALQSSQ